MSTSAQINGFSFYKNDASTIVFALPLGQPDPTHPKRRIKREGAEQSHCVFVAAQPLRRQVVNDIFEEALNTMLKAQADHEATLNVCNQLIIINECAEKTKTWRKKEVSLHLEYTKHVLNNTQAFDEMLKTAQRPRETMRAYLQETEVYFSNFLAQERHEIFYDFLYEIKFLKRGQIQLVFFRTLGMNHQNILQNILAFVREDHLKPLYNAGESFDKLPIEFWARELQESVQLCAIAHYGLEATLWKPDEPFQKLFDLLKQHGPLMMGGKLGCQAYKDSSHDLNEKWGDRAVFGWKKGAIKCNNTINHAVTVIGAMKAEKTADSGYVYYLDPQDTSDPENPTLEKIYKISYKNLQESSRPLSAFRVGEYTYRPTGYAFHRKAV